MPKVEGHTVGAQIGEFRIPQKLQNDLEEVVRLINESEPDRSGEILTRLSQLFVEASATSIGDTETHDGGVLSTDRANFEKRFQPDYHKVRTICTAMRDLGHSIVLTSGTFDIIHIGHAQYIEAASRYGDFLVVGVDSDEKVRSKKGPSRPVVNEQERLRMLAHLRCVDLLTLKQSTDAKWQLLSVVQPDTLIATEGTYTEDEIKILESGYVGRVMVLPPQATTSTTARLRRLQITQNMQMKDKLVSELESKYNSCDGNVSLEDLRNVIASIFNDGEQ